VTDAARYARAIRECAKLLALCQTIQRCGKSVDITHLDVLACRKACIAPERMDIGTGEADEIGSAFAMQCKPYTFDGKTIP
jgi:hypothetical protein